MIAVPPPEESMNPTVRARRAHGGSDTANLLIMPEDAATAPTDARSPWWHRHIELVVVIMLGIVSVATAYTSFQSSLYGGRSADKISQSEASATLAESLYLEGNQQYVQDSQTIQQLSALNIAAQAGDAVASAQYDDLYFIGVSENLDFAIQNAFALDESDPDFWHDPQADEDYLDSLFGSYYDESDISDGLRTEGNDLGKKGDTLGLYTALMAITLFLLGIAAVVRRPLMKWILVATGGTIFLVTAILVAGIPSVWID
jgi:type II secretory pathway pseudopilin PulG